MFSTVIARSPQGDVAIQTASKLSRVEIAAFPLVARNDDARAMESSLFRLPKALL